MGKAELEGMAKADERAQSDFAKEKATKGNLGAIRSALSIYYGDKNGSYPADISVLTAGGKYLQGMPAAYTPPYHPDSAAIHYGAQPDDTGGWLYNNDIHSANYGTVLVNCTHTDRKGTAWNSY